LLAAKSLKINALFANYKLLNNHDVDVNVDVDVDVDDVELMLMLMLMWVLVFQRWA